MDLDETDVLVNLKEFLATRQCLVRDDYFMRDKNVTAFIKNDIDLPEAAFTQLAEICNSDQLNTNENQKILKEIDDLNSSDLSSVEFIKKCYGDSVKKTQAQDFKFMKNLAKLNELVPDENDRISTPDIVLTAQLSQGINNKKTPNKLAWSEDFLILGQNYLSSLKDKITCFRNEIRVGEFSENLEKVNESLLLKDLIKSGYFFIEDTFYNDLRNDNNDCSVQVKEWAKKNNIANFKSERMESTKFIDLSVKLGFPYLYTHLGDCEHLLIFTSLKMINPATDCYSLSKYPILKDKSRGRFSFCWLCNKIYAKWVVCNSEYAVDDPTFLCERCLKNTHYKEKDTFIGSKDGGEVEDLKEGNDLATVSTRQSDEMPEKLFDFKAYHFSQL